VSGAYEQIKENNPLPSICGRICSAPCEKVCILNSESAPISIRALERYVSDFGKSKISRKKRIPTLKDKVAIIGSGPCGLVASVELSKMGYNVAIFESFNKPGGVLRYGIPNFRIPKRVLDGDINEILSCGVEVNTNYFVGQIISLDEIINQGFSAILIATGAGIPKFRDLEGTDLAGVYYGEEFLMRLNLMKSNIFSRNIPTFSIGRNIAVIGSGNTALDCARAAVRFDRDVTVIFRRTEDKMRVNHQEKELAKEEGVMFESLASPVSIVSNKNNTVAGLKCLKVENIDKKISSKWKPKTIPGTEFILDVDTVVIAAGHRPNSMRVAAMDTVPLELRDDYTVLVDGKGMTSIEGIFAAGNVVTNAGPLIQAMEQGKKVAKDIDEYLRK